MDTERRQVTEEASPSIPARREDQQLPCEVRQALSIDPLVGDCCAAPGGPAGCAGLLLPEGCPGCIEVLVNDLRGSAS